MSAKDIIVEPVSARDAKKLTLALHYSGKAVNNSQLHFGVFLNGKCGGVMQFGPSMDKRKIVGLVADTEWNGFIELNRMAFADWLPRNSESRALSVAMRLIRKHYPQLKWVISFADACQCGDGTIYRAAGFVLTDARPNRDMYRLPNGEAIHKLTLEAAQTSGIKKAEVYALPGAPKGIVSATQLLKAVGAQRIPGFMMRYIYFLDPAYRAKLTVPELPFSRIAELGASMYKGKSTCAAGVTSAQPPFQAGGSG